MKICMLAPEFFPIWGGVGTYIIEVLRHLPTDIEVHVVAPWRYQIGIEQVSTQDYRLQDYFADNVHVHFISKATDVFVYNLRFQYACLKHVPQLVKDEQIDLIHSHTANMPDLFLRLREKTTPILTTIHTTIQGQRAGTKAAHTGFSTLESSEKATFYLYPFLRLLEEIYFRDNRYYLTVSNWMRDQLIQQYPRQHFEKIPVIHNSIDLNNFMPNSRSRNQSQNETVLFTGRLTSAKGISFIIKAMPHVIREFPNVVFKFIGPGDPAPYIAQLNKHRIPQANYRFLGYLKNGQDLLPHYQSCSIYLAPTLYENLPIRVLEAMGCEAPVIASNVCGIPEIITSDENGILIPPQSPKALINAICTLLRDPKKRRDLGIKGRQTIEKHFSWKENITKLITLYERVIDSHSKLHTS
jgi:glycosyltransferase involved in cell wall biosynthesis